MKLSPVSLCVLSFFALTFSFPAALRAQSAEEILKTIPTADQQVITRLGKLNTLPSGEWRFHAGDVPHGESASLDDSAWPVAQLKSEGPNEAVWYRQWVEVPKSLHGYDLTGTRIWFQFKAYANGPMPQIIYFNGRRVALGDDLEPIVLFDDAKPGDKVLVAVKLLATVDKKQFGGSEMKIDFAANRSNPEDERTEFISAALLVPSLSTNVAPIRPCWTRRSLRSI